MPAPRAFLPVSLLASIALLASLTAPGLAAPAPAVPAKKPTPFPSTASAAAPVELVEDLDGGGKINWSSGRMSVSGVGTPGDRGAMSYRRTLAARAARADAYRRMAAALELIRVDTNSRLKDIAVIDDALRARLNDFVKSAKLLETNYWPDGSAELVLGTELKGDRSLATLIGAAAGAAAVPMPAPSGDLSTSPMESAAPSPVASLLSPDPSPTPSKEIVTSPVNLRSFYSALIVDARGLGAQPALLPQVRDKDGKTIELNHGALKFLRDGAELDPVAGINPLRVKAQRTQGTLRADFVLGADASDQLKAALRDKKMGAGYAVLIVL